jgi:adenylate cyclase
MNVMENELSDAVDSIIKARWDVRAGQVVPETNDITLGNSGVTLDATVLYADLADSTELAIFDREIAAEVYKAYLIGTTRLIKAAGGEIRSFDGDRVMGVFIGNFKNTSAAKAALKINYFFTQMLEPSFQKFYQRLQTSSFRFAQSVGIDTGELRVARAGVRNDNDLIWVGGAPNIAAKLSSIREQGYSTYITEAVFKKLHDSAKSYNGQSMWERRSWARGGPYGASIVYRSPWWLRPSYNP